MQGFATWIFRKDPLPMPIDASALFSNQNNPMIRLEMTGMELKLALEAALDYWMMMVFDEKDDAPTSNAAAAAAASYPYAAGLQFAVDLSQEPLDRRVTHLQQRQRQRQRTNINTTTTDWVLLHPTTTVTVLVNAFIASGNNGYWRLTSSIQEDAVGVTTQWDASETFLEYSREQGTLLAPLDASTLSYMISPPT
jgi:hypothetical protein